MKFNERAINEKLAGYMELVDETVQLNPTQRQLMTGKIPQAIKIFKGGALNPPSYTKSMDHLKPVLQKMNVEKIILKIDSSIWDCEIHYWNKMVGRVSTRGQAPGMELSVASTLYKAITDLHL